MPHAIQIIKFNLIDCIHSFLYDRLFIVDSGDYDSVPIEANTYIFSNILNVFFANVNLFMMIMHDFDAILSPFVLICILKTNKNNIKI